MKSWLKYFFGGFFSHKLSRESGRRNVFNALLATALSFVMLLFGLFSGYVASFKTHYKNAQQFQSVLYNLLGDQSVNFKIENGVAVGDGRVVDTFGGLQEYFAQNGYQVVLDTNKTATNYAEFEQYCVNNDTSAEISYREYLALDKAEQDKYTPKIRYTGNSLELSSQLLEQCRQHLDEVSNPNSRQYNKTAEKAYNYLKKQQHDLTENDFNCKLYELYCVTYYKRISAYEQFSDAPVMKTYYINQAENCRKYVVILDDAMFGKFVTDSGVEVEFSGYFAKIGNVDFDDLTQRELQQQTDKLVLTAFRASTQYALSTYLLNVLTSFPLVLVAGAIYAVIMAITLKKCKDDYDYLTCLKTVFLYLTVTAFFVFVLSFALSFVCSRQVVYAVAVIAFFVVLLARSIVFTAVEGVQSKRRYRELFMSSDHEQ